MAKKEIGWVDTWRIVRGPYAMAPDLLVHVSRLAIKFAIPNCPKRCAVANQLHLDGFYGVRMGLSKDGKLTFTVIFLEEGIEVRERWEYTDLPFSVIKKTYDIDAERPVAPFKFRTGNGYKYRMVPDKRRRYAGGKRRGPRKVSRSDKGASRTVRREHLKAILES